jgi:7,8-dihydropterin-6-yl-methyl-4-(beta-D-ribofuranosyl)aminobenzene 5'-phosphate synthase
MGNQRAGAIGSMESMQLFRRISRLGSWLILAALIAGAAAAEPAQQHHSHALKITVLVTNLAGDPHEGDGEWGYSALVELDGHRILYDTGSSPDMVLKNASALKIDLSNVEDVVLSHNHYDHVGGLMVLRRELAKINPRAMSRVHVGAGIFEPRLNEAGQDQNGLRLIRAEYLATGGAFVVHDQPTELFPGLWFTGPVPRANLEKNWTPGLSLATAQGRIEDNVPEDSALVFATDAGMVILTGCAHAGIVNITEYARTIVGSKPVVAIVGGLHLFAASDQTLVWTGAKLKFYQVASLLAGHCTGIEATYRLRESLGLSRKTAVVSAVGSSFTLGAGFETRRLAQ